MKKLCLIFLLFSMHLGCGWNPFKGAENTTSQVHRFEEQNENKIRESYNKAYVLCDPKDCPDFVGSLFLLFYENEKLSLGACTVNLIAPNRLLTNAHCIPSDIRENRSNCAGRLKVSFPANSRFKAESYPCSKIIAFSDYKKNDDTPIQADWAIIEFQGESPRTPVEIKAEGVSVKEKVLLYKTDYENSLSGEVKGHIVSTECQANNNHFQVRDNIGSQGPLFNIANCTNQLYNGNSGTGVLNSKHQLIGVFSFARFVEDSQDEWAKELREAYPKLTQTYGGGTNLGCVKTFNEGPLSPICYYGNFKSYNQRASLYQKIYQSFENVDGWSNVKDQIAESLFENTSPLMVWEEGKKSNLQVRYSTSLQGDAKTQQLWLYQKNLSLQLPFRPKCIQPQAPEKFIYEVPIVETKPILTSKNKMDLIEYDLQSTVDPDTLMATQELFVNSHWFSFRKVSPQFYRMQNPTGDILSAQFIEMLEIEPQSTYLEIPLCP